jgi:hypothetical protein
MEFSSVAVASCVSDERTRRRQQRVSSRVAMKARIVIMKLWGGWELSGLAVRGMMMREWEGMGWVLCLPDSTCQSSLLSLALVAVE